MSNVPKLRFKEFSGEWQEKKYGDIYSFYTTNSFSRDNLNYDSGNVFNIHYGDIHTKFSTMFHLENEEVPYINQDVKIDKIKDESYCQIGDLVIADASEDYNDVGKTMEIISLNNSKTVAGLHTFLARPNKVDMALGYAGYMLQSWKVRKQVMQIAQGTKVLGIATGRLGKIKLDVPSKKEQEKIASFLTSVDTKIEQLTKKEALLKQYKKGVMQQVFSQDIRFKTDDGSDFEDWEEKKLGDVLLDSRLGGNYANSEKENSNPLIKMGNLDRGKIVLNKLEYIEENETIDDKDLIQYGDLFFNTRNTLDLVGKVAIWRNELPVAYYNSNLMWMKFENNFFMNYRLNSFDGIKALRRIATGTTSVAAIYTKDLLKVTLSIPCLEEQTKIAHFLSSIDTKIEQVQKQLEATKTFKKGLLQQMFV